MKTVDDIRISTEALAGFLDVKSGTFRNWQNRDGLLQGGTLSGRGRRASFSFSDCLKAYVAKQLIEMSVSTSVAATIANHSPALDAFMNGAPLVVGVRDGKPALAYDPDRDIAIHIPLEEFGWSLADWFCHHIALSAGKPGAFQTAKRDFEERVNLHRINKQ
ncbi:MAG: Phage terminase small subunit [Rhodobacteraceae bacterium HLUCCA12]|nr:MAG: Phage terminase small subunit [Rhodobacteraceae bacterium HLUCCA12]